MYEIYWKAQNPKFPLRPCEGYFYKSERQADIVADTLNRETKGASGKYIARPAQ